MSNKEEVKKVDIKLRIRKFLKEIIDLLSPNVYSVLGFTALMDIVLILGYFITKSSSLLFIILLLLIPVFVMFFCKDTFEELKQQKKLFNTCKNCIMLNFFMIVNHLAMCFTKMINSNTTTNSMGIDISFDGVGTIVILLADFIIFFFLTFYLKSARVQNQLDVYFEFNFLEYFNLLNFEDMTKGDIYICQDSKKDIPVRLPYTDRFLHMLIIGPTGCGKTSQIITPMLNQDVQNLEAGVTVIEPKGDLAEKIYAMAQYYGRKAIYFNPQLDACPSFNPLYGKEEDVIENIVTTFKMLDPDAKQYFQDMNEQLLRNALKILKRFKGNKATLIDLNTLISNPGGEGRMIVNKFMKLPAKTESEQKENLDCATYFLENYFNEKSKTYENCSGVRSQVAKITSNKFLRKVLNPTNGKSDLDFEKCLEDGEVLCITTAQGKLRDLGSFLGYFIILNFQSAVFKRPGNEDNRRPHFLYIDEFQKYSNPGFADMLTQGRSYRVASHLATQARAQIGMGSGKDGNAFINLVSTNCRNIVVFPGVSYDDAKYYSDQFGQDMIKKRKVSVSHKELNPIHGFDKIGYDNISEGVEEKLESRFTPTDIIYQKKQHMTFGYVKNMVVQVPVSGKINYIPIDLNKRLNVMIGENELLMKYGKNPNDCRDLSVLGAPLFKEWESQIDDIARIIKEKEIADRQYEDTSTPENNVKSDIEKDLGSINPMDFVTISENPQEYNKKKETNFEDLSKKSSGIQLSEDDLKGIDVAPVNINTSMDEDDDLI